MALSFMFSNPPGASPDESAHYLRAIGVGHGQLVLERPPPWAPAPPELARQTHWLWMQSGVVEVPEQYSPAPFECWGRPFYVGICNRSAPDSGQTVAFDTYVGVHPPFVYLVPGVLMRASDDSTVALMLGRAGILLGSMGFISAAALALYRPSARLWLAGLISAVTPMVLVTAASLSSSGVEIAAAICLFACLLRLVRPDAEPAPRWVWVMAGLGAAAVAVARDPGPMWVALHVGLIAILVGWQRLRTVWSQGGRPAWVGGALALVALVVALGWRAGAGVNVDVSALQLPALGLGEVGGLVRQVVGVFGPLDTLMPDIAYRIWAAMALFLLVAALWSGSARQRIALLTAIAATGAVFAALEAAHNIYGFSAQARHVMPAAVCVPLLAGEVLAAGKRPRWIPARVVMPALAGLAGIVHLAAWHTLGRRFAVGLDGPAMFVSDPVWSPPGGWISWMVVMSLACLVLILPFLWATED